MVVVYRKSPTFEPETLSSPDACKFLGIGRSHLWALMQRGELAYVMIGKRRLIRLATLRKFLDDREVPAKS